MTPLVCRAHPQVEEHHRNQVERAATRRLTSVSAVSNREILSPEEASRRSRQICQATGLCGLGLPGYARRVTDELRPAPGWDHRTFLNINRVFQSHRVTTPELIELISFMLNPERVTAFRNTARILFSNAQLFYYDYIPFQGAVQCFAEGRA